jgi:SAM-dependent methyltransferase
MSYSYSIEHRKDICNKFIESLKSTNCKFVLDIGPGDGEFSKMMLDAGLEVTAMGNERSEGVYDLRKYKNFKFFDTDVNSPICFDMIGRVDGVFASHVVEHLNNPFGFLKACNRKLSQTGYLCIIVPPFKDQVVDQHIFVGWNVGYLMSLLLRCGFNIRDGKYTQVDYNVAAIVQKGNEIEMRSDVPLLTTYSNLFPPAIEEEIKRNKEHFNGAIGKLNW